MPLSEAKQAAEICQALSVESRVLIVLLLKERSLCVNALAGHLQISAAAVSQHLRVLRQAKLVIADKHGNFVHYRLNPETVAEWKSVIEAVL
jgi:DNA-binding transcriptional ArsR family regulator